MDSRTGLLRAALALFAAKGYDGIGVQEVAEAAGVAKPTLYHFFGSKHGLLEALFAEYATRLDDAVRAAADYAGDLPLTLDRIVAAYIDFAAVSRSSIASNWRCISRPATATLIKSRCGTIPAGTRCWRKFFAKRSVSTATCAGGTGGMRSRWLA